MEEINIKLAQFDDIGPSNLGNIFINYCPLEESEKQVLKDSYSELEGQALILQQTAMAAAKSNGNIFKLINDRLNKLEITIKNPLNLILFRSARSADDSGIQSSNNRLILDPSGGGGDFEKSDGNSFEEVFASLNQNMLNLQTDFKRIQSELSLQQTKVSILILFNSLLFLAILLQIFLNRRSRISSNPKQTALKRRPLLELKSPTSLSSSLSRSSGEIDKNNNPGVVLSDDEVLLLDEEGSNL